MEFGSITASSHCHKIFTKVLPRVPFSVINISAKSRAVPSITRMTSIFSRRCVSSRKLDDAQSPLFSTVHCSNWIIVFHYLGCTKCVQTNTLAMYKNWYCIKCTGSLFVRLKQHVSHTILNASYSTTFQQTHHPVWTMNFNKQDNCTILPELIWMDGYNGIEHLLTCVHYFECDGYNEIEYSLTCLYHFEWIVTIQLSAD